MNELLIRHSANTLSDVLQQVSAALEQAPVYFGHGTDNAWDEAVQLVLGAMGLPADAPAGHLSDTITPDQLAAVERLLGRRITELKPLPYLLGKAWFAGLEFRCDERAIIPRSPIAELIDQSFSPWYHGPEPQRVLDLCCGGGCIGLAIAHYYEQVQVDLVDVDPAALALARENASALGVSERVSIVESDLYAGLVEGRTYDLIVSNPPYVNAQDLASMPAEYHHEPELALGSGPDGLALTHRILAGAGARLQPEGLLVVELGNSWPALETAYPDVPFTWLEFEQGGDGVFAMSASQWQEYSACWSR